MLNPPNPSRRSALRGFGLATLAAGLGMPAVAAPAAAAAAAPDADAELIAACQAFLDADAVAYAPDVADDVTDAAWESYYRALERLTELRAVTPAGRRIKVQAAWRALASIASGDDAHDLEREELAALSALTDLVDNVGISEGALT
jgi:hypothetical protein